MKRLFDILATTCLLILLAIPISCLACAQFLAFGSPIFFRQTRAGLNNKAFDIIKFRSMRSGSGSDEERLTKWGKFIRATSLDELPELINVLKGEMSLVGPRPLPTIYLNRYTPEQAERHTVRPGITGWAQVNGRNNITWEEQFDMDLWYVRNQSLWLDLKILCLTIYTVIRRDNISQEGQATREEFMGSSYKP